MKLKIFTFVTGLLIALCAQAQTSGTAGPLTWSYDAGTKTLSINGTGEMPDYAFVPQPWQAYRNEIQTVTIGNDVTRIGDRAFLLCNALQSFTVPAGVTTIGHGVFDSCPALTVINVDPANTHYESDNGVLYNKGKTELLKYPQGKPDIAFTVPNSVTIIEFAAFMDCNALQNITLPTGLTTIENSNFWFCEALQSITLPASVTRIGSGSGVFNGCSALTAINVNPANSHYESENGVLYTKGKTELLKYPETKPGSTFTVPGSVITIGDEAFARCQALQNITLPTGLTTLEPNAFLRCKSLKNITIPSSVTTIEHGNFYRCESLVSITVDENNPAYKSIAGVLFTKDGTTLIRYPMGKPEREYTVPAGVNTIGERAFEENNNLNKVTIPISVNNIGDYAFAWCYTLSEVIVSWGAPIHIENSTFYSISNNSTLYVPNGKTQAYLQAAEWNKFRTITDGASSIGGTAGPLTWSYDAGTKTLSINGTGAIPDYDYFIVSPWRMYGNEIQTVTIGNGVTKIGKEAFGGLGVMQSITIPASVTEIGDAAFAGCEALQSITIPASVTTIGNRAFRSCEALQSITIPAGVTTIGFRCFMVCPALTAINVDPANTHYESENGVLYTKGKTKLIRYPEGKPGTSFTVPDGVTTIQNGSFYDCRALQDITLPVGVTTIELGSFNGSPTLAAINVDPANTHYESENGVLYTKGKAELIRYPDGKSDRAFTVPAEVTTIGDWAFDNCQALNITLSTRLTTIGNYAFGGCPTLQKITIPAGVTAIGQQAFRYCYNLKEVTVEWNNPLSVGPDIFEGVSLSAVTLKVPAGKKALYQAAPVWKDFGTITESSVTPGTTELTVTPETARMMQVADDLYLSIQSNTDWTATSSEEWLTLSPSSGTKNGTVKATTTTNNDSQDRTATVTVKAGNQTRTVTVTQKGRKAPSSVDLSISEVQLMVGAQIQLSDTVRPWNEDVDREVIWSSSNTRVATVDDTGLVRAVGEGEAVITVQTEIGGFKATCNVTVSKQDAIVIPPPPASPVPDTDKKNVVTLSLTVPTDQGFTLSFVLNLPKGLVLDQEKTKLAESLIEQYTLTITPEGNGWKFEIKPNMLRKAADHFVVKEMVHVAYTADPSVEKGNYDAQIKKLHLTFTDGSTLAKNEIPFKITVHTTTSNELIEANMQVWTAGGRLYVTSPVRETVEVYTFGGKLVFRTVKPAGEAVYDLVMPEGAAIVRGSSGWTKKVKK